MIRSLNEISGLVGKAARGAGLPLGIAEDLAAAVPQCCDGAMVVEALRALSGHLADPRSLIDLVAALDRVEAEGVGVEVRHAIDPLLAALVRHRGTVGWSVRIGGFALAPGVAPAVPQAVPPDVWSPLEAIGARTLVPATAVSRLAGAGSRLGDND